jgi:hypothetical protein
MRHLILAALGLCLFTGPAWAQRVYVVAQSHMAADDAGPGDAERPFKSISAAAALAGPGDTVRVHAGLYRERVAPARGGEEGRPVVYETAPGERVVVRGSDLWRADWKPDPVRPGVLRAQLPESVRNAKYNPFAIALRRLSHRTLGQLIVNGILLTEVPANEVARVAGSYAVTEGGAGLMVRFPDAVDPAKAEVEITVRERLFAPHKRGLGHVTVRGFVFEHAANQFPSGFWAKTGAPQAGGVSARSGHHWVLENISVRFCRNVGVDLGWEGALDAEGEQPRPPLTGYHVVRDSVVSDNGAAGIVGIGATATRIVRNRIERNNTLGHTAPEAGGLKFHYFVDGVIEDNLIRDNDAFGIWLDNVWHGARVSRNVVVNNKGAGIFMEMGEGPALVERNVAALTRAGEGIYGHDSGGVTYAHNLLYGNAHFGLYLRTVTDRKFERADGSWSRVITAGNRVVGNLFVDNYRGALSLPVLDEPWSGKNHSDHNLFVNGTQWQWEGASGPIFVLNGNDGRVSAEAIQQRVLAAVTTAGAGSANGLDARRWLGLPQLSFAEWRAATGHDVASLAAVPARGALEDGAVAKGSLSFSSAALRIALKDSAFLSGLRVPRLPESGPDFFGAERPAGATVHPGPIAWPDKGPVEITFAAP